MTPRSRERIGLSGRRRSVDFLSELARANPTPRWSAGPGPRDSDASGAHNGVAKQPSLPRRRFESVMVMVAAVEKRVPHTERHSLNVSTHAQAIGRRLGLNDNAVCVLATAALLHDIGKIGIPQAILTKPSQLTPDEVRIVREHPEIGVEILRNVGFLRDELPLILHHHERYDGTGYPHGLAGETIPLGARILHVADTIDAMMSPRCYRQACTRQAIMDELNAGRGTQFDPAIVDVALEYLAELADPSALALTAASASS